MISFVMRASRPGEEGIGQRYRDEIAAMRRPGALEAQLARIDLMSRKQPLRRIFVMGCGRSGTWLLTAMMTGFEGVDFLPSEVPQEVFGLLTTDRPALLLKRDHKAYERIEDIPDSIHLVCIVRHPFDVLTSHNPVSPERAYHISPARWLGEMLALQYLVDTKRTRTTILRYEDLVSDPDTVRNRLGRELSLEAATPIEKVMDGFAGKGALAAARKAMHGFRPIDRQSVERFRSDPAALAYLHAVRPRLWRLLDWVAETFGYDVSLEKP